LLFLSPLFSLSLFSGTGKEVRREQWIVREYMGVCKGDYLLL
jgi:hypothetical protein